MTFLADGHKMTKEVFYNLSLSKHDKNVANVSTRLHWSSSGQYSYSTTVSKLLFHCALMKEDQCNLVETLATFSFCLLKAD